MPTKAQMVEAIQSLPEDASIDDALDRLYLLEKIERGLAQVRAGESLSLDQLRDRLKD